MYTESHKASWGDARWTGLLIVPPRARHKASHVPEWMWTGWQGTKNTKIRDVCACGTHGDVGHAHSGYGYGGAAWHPYLCLGQDVGDGDWVAG